MNGRSLSHSAGVAALAQLAMQDRRRNPTRPRRLDALEHRHERRGTQSTGGRDPAVYIREGGDAAAVAGASAGLHRQALVKSNTTSTAGLFIAASRTIAGRSSTFHRRSSSKSDRPSRLDVVLAGRRGRTIRRGKRRSAGTRLGIFDAAGHGRRAIGLETAIRRLLISRLQHCDCVQPDDALPYSHRAKALMTLESTI